MIESISEHNPLGTEDMNARRKARFDRLDTNDDGVLSAEEVDTLVSRINEHHNLSLDPGTFAAELDKDGNGQINFDEFGNFRKVIDLPRTSRMPWGKGEHLFSKLNADGDDGVSESEMNDFVARINERSGKSLVTDEVMSALDNNQDGVINKEEMKGLRRVIGPKANPFHNNSAKTDDTAALTDVVRDLAPSDTTLENTAPVDVSI